MKYVRDLCINDTIMLKNRPVKILELLHSHSNSNNNYLILIRGTDMFNNDIIEDTYRLNWTVQKYKPIIENYIFMYVDKNNYIHVHSHDNERIKIKLKILDDILILQNISNYVDIQLIKFNDEYRLLNIIR